MATQPNTLAVRCPRALAAGRIVGKGRFALLSCEDAADKIRRVHLFHTSLERNQLLWKWDRRKQCSSWSTCTEEHIPLDLEE
jgi:hypothetical protein